ncbi:MAG: PTS sugar transporter subunit IIA [Alphaproteobacteria bacterium]|nr:PTS sugar transporter subunit IIA [Alphaproteobacteria bacterium]
MIGLVIVAHGRVGDELRAVLEHILGKQQQMAVVNIGPDDDMECRRQEILDAVRAVSVADQGAVVLTDMFGGTPSNLAISTMGRAKVEVITGLNLPMLIKLVQVRDGATLEEVVKAAQDAGRKYIYVASALLAAKGRDDP